MTVITLNEYKTKDEIIKYLYEFNLIPSSYSDIELESDYFITNQFGDYILNISITNSNSKKEELKYVISYIENEKVTIKNNNGIYILTSVIILIICIFFLIYKLIEKIIIKRKKDNKESMEL